jgi:hypothetical protein
MKSIFVVLTIIFSASIAMANGSSRKKPAKPYMVFKVAESVHFAQCSLQRNIDGNYSFYDRLLATDSYGTDVIAMTHPNYSERQANLNARQMYLDAQAEGWCR